MMRKAALHIGVPMLLVVIGWNAYLAIRHLRQTQATAALMFESSAIQSNISAVLQDITDMETGQRGYLLGGNDSYLQPYMDAKARVGKDISELRSAISARSREEQALESRLETVIRSKTSEMERGIDLRQRGYRHRAFKLVDTNEGKDYMDEIRRVTTGLNSLERGGFATLATERDIRFTKMLSMTLMTNAGVLVLGAVLFFIIRNESRRLEQESADSRQELAARDSQLEKLTLALSGQARSEIVAISTTSRLLLDNYGGFLPRQGHEYAEQVNQAAIEIERLRQDLVGSLAATHGGHAA